MPKLLKRPSGGPKAGTMSLKKFHEAKDRILIVRNYGGAGDILMHRMLFEDIALLLPEAEIYFACPPAFHGLVSDHPFLAGVLDNRVVNYGDFPVSYNTSSACARYEMALAPLSGDHRSDIWASHCGFALTRHDMHFRIPVDAVVFGQSVAEKVRAGSEAPVVAIAPISAQQPKDLTNGQLDGVVRGLRDRGCLPLGVHTNHIPVLGGLNVPVIRNLSPQNWMGVMNAVDYVVSVDTGTFHLAGGLGKPTVGVFAHTDGVVYGKYYRRFQLVQKHRKDGDWPCGPCYTAMNCPKTQALLKPCLTEITPEMILEGFDRLRSRFPL
jgi:ADP-heptose:LPS heptosyltransferase